MNQDIQMPMFGKAGGGSGATQSDWAETDNFDVELLAEYLLDDAAMPNVSFDFKMDSALNGSGVVSPENSEDGAMPPVAEHAKAPMVPAAKLGAVPAPVPLQQPSGPVVANVPPVMPTNAPNNLNPTPIAPAQMAPLAPLAPNPGGMAMFPTMPVVPVPPSQNPMMLHHQQHPGAPADANAAKRRRMDQQTPLQPHPIPGAPPPGMPMLAVAGMNPAALLSGQQLAAAAAQAMQQQGRGVRKKSQAQIDRRRERNRILARRTRLRKKFFFESLQKEVMDLQKENAMLKELVKLNLKDEDSKPVLDECDAMEKMPPSVLEAIGETASEIESKDFNLVKSIQTSQHAFIITDPSLQDNPIVFASDDFCKMSGYKREEVLGRNCRFLQGSETCKEKLEKVRKAIKLGEDVTVTFINYTADGTPFWNKLFIAALRDAQNNIVNFIGVTVKVAGPMPDDPEHGKSLPVVDGSAEKDDGEDANDDDEEEEADAAPSSNS